MADYGSVQSPKIIYRQLTTSSLFASPRLFTGFASKGCISGDTESIPSPTSILKNPFWPEPNTPKTPKPESKNPFEKLDSRGLVDALIDENADSNDASRTNTRMVLFGSNLKIQVPRVVSPNESPKSPTDFGIKTRGSAHLGPFSPRLNSNALSGLSPGEMERSEDYTCVISYGPNPRTTHIFDDCIVESCCGVVKLSESRFSERAVSCYPSESFLSSCYGCKKSLGQGKDIYMYRGEKAFCSNECRCTEMMLEESLEPDDYDFGAP